MKLTFSGSITSPIGLETTEVEREAGHRMIEGRGTGTGIMKHGGSFSIINKRGRKRNGPEGNFTEKLCTSGWWMVGANDRTRREHQRTME